MTVDDRFTEDFRERQVERVEHRSLLDVHLDVPDLQLGQQGQGWLVAQARIDLHGLCPGCQQSPL